MRSWVALFPEDTLAGAFCKPGVSYTLAMRRNVGFERFCFPNSSQFVRLMTHPADARAGWHLEAHSVKSAIDALSPFPGDIPFNAFHWILAHQKVAFTSNSSAQNVYIEQVQFAPSVVLHSPHHEPMRHGLWVEYEDLRCEQTRTLNSLLWPRSTLTQPVRTA